MRWAMVMVVAAGCMTPVIPFGEGKTARQAQRDTMTELGPASLVPSTKWEGDVATARIRVWADDDFRAQNVHWQQAFEAQLEVANLVLGPLFGVRLAPDYRSWDHRGTGTTLADELEALTSHDPGNDVLVVVGLTSSLPLVSATFDDLGYAALGGRHMVLRGYADLEERKVYADAFRDLLPEERELSLQARRQHKTVVVLLHELAHTMGADHDAEPDTLMSAHYSHRSSAFSSTARDTVRRGFDQRLRRGAPAAAPPAEVARAAPPGASPAASRAGGPGQQPAATGPLVIDITETGVVEHAGAELGPVEVDRLLTATHTQDPSRELVVRRARGAPKDTTKVLTWIVSRAEAVGMRVSMTQY